MKTKLTALTALSLATQALAHTAALPHTHEGLQTNWLPGIACAVAALAVGCFAWKAYKTRSAK